MLFENDWGTIDSFLGGSDQQLKCLESMVRLMSDFNVDRKTDLLSNEAIDLLGPKPYPGVSPEICFKLVGFIDISQYGMVEGDKAITYYAKTIDNRLQDVLSRLRKENKERRLYGTTHRKGGDEFVIVIAGVLTTSGDNQEDVRRTCFDKVRKRRKIFYVYEDFVFVYSA